MRPRGAEWDTPLILRKIIEVKGLNWLNWRLTVLSYHKSRDRNDLGPFLFWPRFYLFSQFTRSEFWTERKKHPREIIFYHENSFVSFFYWSLLDYPKSQKVRNSEIDDRSVLKAWSSWLKIYLEYQMIFIIIVLSDGEESTLVRSCGQKNGRECWVRLWTIYTALVISVTTKFNFRKTPGNVNKGLSESK